MPNGQKKHKRHHENQFRAFECSFCFYIRPIQISFFPHHNQNLLIRQPINLIIQAHEHPHIA